MPRQDDGAAVQGLGAGQSHTCVMPGRYQPRDPTCHRVEKQESSGAEKMSKSLNSFSRRAMLATGAAALATPLIARRSLASSGEVNVFAWVDYFADGL